MDSNKNKLIETNYVQDASKIPRISVIIPHYNDFANLRNCLDCLADQTIGLAKFEIIVADNMSDGGLAAVQAVCGANAKVILATERGPGPARNTGVAAATALSLAFTDSDCSPDRSWLEEGLKALGQYDLIGGKMQVTVKSEQAPTPVECFEKVFAFRNRQYVEERGYTVTANMFAKRQIFDKVGGFGAATIAEDADWCRRVTCAGFTLGYAPLACVSHPARRKWLDLRQKWRRMMLHQFNEIQLLPRSNLRWIIFNFKVLMSPFLHIFIILRSSELENNYQRLGAIAVLFKLRIWRFAEGLALLRKRDFGDPWRQRQ